MRRVSTHFLCLGLALSWSSSAPSAAPSAKSGLQVLKGAYSGKDADARYVALIEDGRLLQVTEYRDLGERGRSVVTFRFDGGAFAIFAETSTRRIALGPSGSGSTAGRTTTLQLFFTEGRFTGGSKSVDGSAAEPSEAEKRRAVAQAEEARLRVEARFQAPAAPSAVPPPPADAATLPAVAFDCEDGIAFVARFDREGRRAVIDAKGREPVSLPELPSGSGFRYSDGHTGLRGKGDEAVFKAADGRSVRCRASGKTTPTAD